MTKTLIMVAGCLLFMACNNDSESEKKAPEGTASASTETKATPQSEFADAKYTELGKKFVAQMSAGDIENGWGPMYADNAVYIWSNGDSLAGKKAIIDYWKNRRANVIDSISFSNDIWLPIKINTPQKGPDMPGIWLLSWYQVNVKYKNGKKLSFWTHTDHHFDANDKVDRTIQYMDMAPIKEALAAK